MVGHRERVGVAQVDLVLTRRHLVVVVLDLDPHILEDLDRLAAEVGAEVHRDHVEVAAPVEDIGRPVVLEVEILQLGPDHPAVTEVGGVLQGALEGIARVALVRVSVRRDDVAEHPGLAAFVLRSPREQAEGGRVGHRDHIALLDPREPLDRGAVEAHPGLQGLGQLGACDGEALEPAENVGEPEAYEPDIVLLDEFQNL